MTRRPPRWRGRLASLLLALLTWLVLHSATAHAAPLGARAVLADDAFGFCHDERYPLTDEEALWCPLLPAHDPPCPTFQAACGAPRAAEGSGPQWRRTAEKSEGKEAERKRGARGFGRERERESEAPPTTKDAGLGTLAHVMVWVIVAAMLIAVLLQLRGPSARSPRAEPEPKPDEPEPDEAAAALLPTETDVDRLLARAVARAERGELDAAVADGHAALVRRLAEHGHIRLHSSRTNGDHVRDLRGEPALYEPTRQVMRIVERVQFGHTPISRADVDRLISQVRSVLGAVAGMLLLLWTTLACDSDQPHRYPWSHSPSGTAAVFELLRSHDLELEYRKTTLDHPSGLQDRTPIVLDESNMSPEEWSVLMAHVRGGGDAVLATRESLPAELGVSGAKRAEGALQPGADQDDAPRLAIPGDAGLSWTGDEGIALYTDGQGTPYALLRSLGAGTILVLADDRLLTNGALAVPDNDLALVQLLRDLGPRFELVDGGLRSVAGNGGASDPFEAVSRAHLTPVILQLLLLMLLLYLWRGVHFGRPRDPPPPSRRRFVEHVEALAQQYHRAGARRHALRLYAGWALDRVSERFGGRRRGLHHLAHRISARTGRDETKIMHILAEAHHARDDQDGHGSEDDLRVLRELGQLIDTTQATHKRSQGTPKEQRDEPGSLQ